MAQNPRFNNSDMFTNIKSDDYSEITPDSKSEVLATQGNVINSIKVFWNNLKAKLAYAVTRPNTNDAVGGNYQPVYVNNSGDVIPCSPSVFQTAVNNSTINLPEAFPIYAGQTVCFNVTNGSGDNNGDLKIGNISVYYPTGATVKGSDVIGGSYLFTYISGNGDKWILNNKINVVSSANAGLMTIEEHNKLHGIQEGANAYSLPAATSSGLGGVQLGYTENGQNYKVQKDDNNNLFVNVPWTDTDTHHTALLKVGGTDSKENQITTNGNTYLQIVEADRVTSQRLIKGTKSVSVTSDSNGNITIEGTDTKYPVLWNSGNIKNYDEDTPYTVYGPGSGMANQNNYLRGDGTWGPVAASMGRMAVSITNGTFDQSSSFYGTIKVTYNGSPIQFALLHGSNFKVSNSSGQLLINGLSIKTGSTLNEDTTALIVPIGNLSLKPQILHFTSATSATFMD